MLKKLGTIVASAALVFAVGACGKKQVKLNVGNAPKDTRLAAFQGDWVTSVCMMGSNGAYNKHEIVISGDVAQFIQIQSDQFCQSETDFEYGEEVEIKALDNGKAQIKDEYGNVHILSVSNGTLTNELMGWQLVKR